MTMTTNRGPRPTNDGDVINATHLRHLRMLRTLIKLAWRNPQAPV
jgi:hypothetical protein